MPLHRSLPTLVVSLALAACSLSAVRAQTATFNFDNVPVGAVSPLTLTQNGITVTFTDDLGLPQPGKPFYDDGQFGVGPAGGSSYPSSFAGNILSSANGYSGANHPLVILFSRPATALSLDFATTDVSNPNPRPVNLSAYSGTTLVGTQSVTPALVSLLPSGHLNFSSTTAFNRISLSASPVSFLMVDNVQVTAAPAAVPEASSLAVFAGGLLGVMGLTWRARRRKAISEA